MVDASLGPWLLVLPLRLWPPWPQSCRRSYQGDPNFLAASLMIPRAAFPASRAPRPQGRTRACAPCRCRGRGARCRKPVRGWKGDETAAWRALETV
ncbi:hypothetical protein BT67DRAFT_289925 [Trichocladium antarcticum]|uniref:Uncharacterized protein n=1 Tax=Trichocladium antarcticum TaxID=1450529 RepID=A0AAN6ZES0_9PEZI|nr:hypothetical protein BT67DRAFT_289925 [Trichocladium antarcticum]